MKYRLIVLLTALVAMPAWGAAAPKPDFYAAFHDLPKTVKVYHYKVPKKTLRAELAAAKKRKVAKLATTAKKRALKKAITEAKEKAREAVQRGAAPASAGATIIVTTSNVLVLPRLYVFDSSGRAIYARTGAPKNLVADLNHAFLSTAPMTGAKPLRARMNSLIPVSQSSASAPRQAGRFTLLEYWAPWCTYCFTERDQLLSYFENHKAPHVNWITVDDDFTKVAHMKAPPDSSD